MVQGANDRISLSAITDFVGFFADPYEVRCQYVAVPCPPSIQEVPIFEFGLTVRWYWQRASAYVLSLSDGSDSPVNRSITLGSARTGSGRDQRRTAPLRARRRPRARARHRSPARL